MSETNTPMRPTEAVDAVRNLHRKAVRTVEGYTLEWCVECQQDWPCPTTRILNMLPDRTEDP